MPEPLQSLARVAEGGRIVIPAAYRKALGIEPGDEVLLRMDDDGLLIISRELALRRLQSRIAAAVPSNVSLVDELIHDRREEARGR